MDMNHHLRRLGEQIAATGVDAHARELARLAESISDHAPGTASVLVDTGANEVLRQRAFAVAVTLVLDRGARAYRVPEPVGT